MEQGKKISCFAGRLPSNHYYLNEVSVEGKVISKFKFRVGFYDQYIGQVIRTGNGITLLSNNVTVFLFYWPLSYEIEEKLRIGSELYYFSRQHLSDGSIGRGYWVYSLVPEKEWKHLSLYINFENIGNVRQTKFEDIYTGIVTKPVFENIYAPLDGFVMNGGLY